MFSGKLLRRLASLLFCCAVPAIAQDFGTVVVGASPGSSQKLVMNFHGVLQSLYIFSEGVTGKSNTEFREVSNGTCVSGATDSCELTVEFAPLYPGLRKGAVMLLDAKNGILATAYIHGIATAPQLSFSSASQASLGVGPGPGLAQPQGGTADLSGNLYVASQASRNVIFVTSGNTTAVVPGLTSPLDVARDGAGELYVADWGKGIVKVTRFPLAFTQALVGNVTYPGGLAVDGDASIYVTNVPEHSLLKITSDGKQSVVTSDICKSPNGRCGVALDAHDNIYVADLEVGAVWKISLADGHKNRLPIPNLSGSSSIASDAAGDIYIADPASRTVARVQPDGKPQPAISVNTVLPGNVVLDDDARIYVIDPSAVGRVAKFDQAKAPSLAFTSIAQGATSAPQQITLTNTGSATLTISEINTSSANFRVGGSCNMNSQVLVPGASCQLNVIFAPVAYGQLRGILGFKHNSLNQVNGQTAIALSGYASSKHRKRTKQVSLPQH